MTIFLTIIHVIVCFALIGVILLQAGKGQGLAGASFGGGSVQSAMGTRAGDVMTKATTVVALLFLFTCIALSFIAARESRSLYRGASQQAPLDLNEIQKALEDIKADAVKDADQIKSEVAAKVDAPVVNDLEKKAAEQVKVAEKRAEAALAS